MVDVPGHCDDQVAFHLPERGVLFSGDAFIHERPKYFRSDEDWHSTVNSLRQLVQLDFDHLLCAHRPRVGSGKTALLQKLQVRSQTELCSPCCCYHAPRQGLCGVSLTGAAPSLRVGSGLKICRAASRTYTLGVGATPPLLLRCCRGRGLPLGKKYSRCGTFPA